MTEKRFTIKGSWSKSLNRLKGVICDNNEDMYITDVVYLLNDYDKENEELKQLIKELEKQIHLIHMSSMFSTVKSFKGDVSKRYKYSEETDTIYDTANHYGQYHKILDKKEVTMLLNEYNTLLEESNEK